MPTSTAGIQFSGPKALFIILGDAKMRIVLIPQSINNLADASQVSLPAACNFFSSAQLWFGH